MDDLSQELPKLSCLTLSTSTLWRQFVIISDLISCHVVALKTKNQEMCVRAESQNNAGIY